LKDGHAVREQKSEDRHSPAHGGNSSPWRNLRRFPSVGRLDYGSATVHALTSAVSFIASQYVWKLSRGRLLPVLSLMRRNICF